VILLNVTSQDGERFKKQSCPCTYAPRNGNLGCGDKITCTLQQQNEYKSDLFKTWAFKTNLKNPALKSHFTEKPVVAYQDCRPRIS
jgi:hypothetical protein